jgi:hypothetical protein
MRARAYVFVVLIAAACGGGGSGSPDGGPPAWLQDSKILVPGVGVLNSTCTGGMVCPHNENTDLFTYQGAIYLVHRTANSQVLNHNCSLRFYKSTDGGKTYQFLTSIDGPDASSPFGMRDLRDPSLYETPDGKLAFKALIRMEITSTRDSGVDTITVGAQSSDGGMTWSALMPLVTVPGNDMWSFWRIKKENGVYYSAAYEDGDLAVKLFSSTDGLNFTPGATIYSVAADTPLETELVFMPSGRMLALVRMDGTDEELLGNVGRLRTKVCWAMPPYDTFDCPQELTGQRLDGPVAFFHNDRLFVVARKHFIEPRDRKRTTLFEIGGTLEGGPLTISDLGDFPSAGDTAYAGVADADADHVAVTWYSSDLVTDEPWARAIFEASDIRQATIDFTKIP